MADRPAQAYWPRAPARTMRGAMRRIVLNGVTRVKRTTTQRIQAGGPPLQKTVLELANLADGDAAALNYSVGVLADRPIAYYRLNEPAGAVKAIDSSGNGKRSEVIRPSGITLQQPGLGAGDRGSVL